MKIEGTRPLGVTSRVASKGSGTRIAESATASERNISDITTVMGIPKAELTPKVYAAIMSLLEEVKKLRREVEHGKSRISHLEKLADQDSLMPITNRRAFVREMSRIMAFSQRYELLSGVLYFDLNGMKEINDTYGHAAGDAALKLLGHVLVENVRQSDVVGRLGGDEFGVILAQTDHEAAKEKAASLAQVIENTRLVWESQEIRLSVASGAYCFSQGESVDTALAHADKAMYEDKLRKKVDT